MNYRELNEQIKTNQLQPIYLFVGDEQFVKARCLKRLCDAALSGGPQELNLNTFDESAQAEDVIGACLNMPLFSNRRVVVYRDCPMLKANGKDTGEQALLEYLNQPAQDAILVFYMSDKADNRKALTKALSKLCKVDFTTLSEGDIHSFLSIDAKQRGYRVSRKAIDKLIFYVGRDMTTLVNEMEKAYAYAHPGNDVDENTIDAIATRSVEADAFAIVDDLMTGKMERAQQQLDELLTDPGATQALFGAIAYRLRMVLSARQAMDAGLKDSAVSKQVKGPRFAVEKAIRDAKRMNAKRIKDGLCALAEADAAIKSGRMRDRVALNHALMKAFAAPDTR